MIETSYQFQFDKKGNVCIEKKTFEIVRKKVKNEKTETGYKRAVTIYACDSCDGCPHKTECIKGNNCKTPMSERNKALSVSRVM